MDKQLERFYTLASIAFLALMAWYILKPRAFCPGPHCNRTDGYCFTHNKGIQ